MITDFNVFKKVNESSDLRVMSFTIPEKKTWKENGENLGISFLGRTFTIPQDKVKEFEENIGKTVSFKYNPNENIMMLPIIKEEIPASNESLNPTVNFSNIEVLMFLSDIFSENIPEDVMTKYKVKCMQKGQRFDTPE